MKLLRASSKVFVYLSLNDVDSPLEAEYRWYLHKLGCTLQKWSFKRRIWVTANEELSDLEERTRAYLGAPASSSLLYYLDAWNQGLAQKEMF